MKVVAVLREKRKPQYVLTHLVRQLQVLRLPEDTFAPTRQIMLV